MTAATQPITVEDAAALAGLTYAWEAEYAPDASPMAGPAWLRASNGIDPRVPPARYLLTRPSHDQLAALPIHIVHSPATLDADPRSYFGGTTDTAPGQVCCGSQQASPAAQILADIDTGELFPALVLGSLPGYKTEILHSYWTPQLAAELLDAAIAFAREQNIPTIVAPWVADRGSGKALARELHHRGAVASFWAAEDYLPLRHRSLQAQLDAARNRDRYRYRQDMRAAQALGLAVRTLTTSELRASLPRIGVLTAATRQRHSHEITELDVRAVLGRLLDLDVPLLCVGGFRNGELAACCISVIKAGRVYAKFAGFDYDALGAHSGAYFAVVMYGTLTAAYDHKARAVEYGVGAHQAKALRGCQPRDITSYLLTSQPRVHDVFSAAAAVNTPHRRADYGPP
ncbi:MAG: peptidogalycan biosysnthesis protein [Micromonosporaceae bacterium]